MIARERGLARPLSAWNAFLRNMDRGLVAGARNGVVCVVSTLDVYLDDSGIHDGARFCVLTGYIASPRQWLLFGERWQRQLKDIGLDDFHAKRFFARAAKPYNSLTRDERRLLLDGLLDAIGSHRLNPLGATVSVEDFNALAYGERRFLTGAVINERLRITGGAPFKPFFLAFQHCLCQAAKLAKPGKVVEFVFDQQEEFSPLALELFLQAKNSMAQEARKKIGGCSFRDRREVGGPLHAADLLAHCWYSFKQKDWNMSVERRRAFARLCGGDKPGLHRYDAPMLECLLKDLSPQQRAALRADIRPMNLER